MPVVGTCTGRWAMWAMHWCTAPTKALSSPQPAVKANWNLHQSPQPQAGSLGALPLAPWRAPSAGEADAAQSRKSDQGPH